MAAHAPRKIIHVDMDAFYASVEQRDRPELRGKPVIVGGPPDSRGVVCAASYEARTFGVHSAMPSSHAYRKCPHGVFLRPDFPRYSAVSKQVRAVFHSVTDLVEPLSLDEAYLDVTSNALGEPSATRVAEEVRRRIHQETGLTASAGIAPNKFLAKIASDMRKPDGIFVIRPQDVAGFVENLPVRKVPGIGRVTERHCHEHGIKVCSDFLSYTEAELTKTFGKAGHWFHQIARGIDRRPVRIDSVRKSQSVEDTFATDIVSRDDVVSELERLAATLEGRLLRAETSGRTVNLKVKYADFTIATRSRTLELPVQTRDDLVREGVELLALTEVGERPIRLLGIGISSLVGEGDEQQLYLPFK
ncbi:MAG: DNA polymerase IV [Planctomycetes bacterium]|nr:DNA polymerase IV [Planctomycetota bacterium]